MKKIIIGVLSIIMLLSCLFAVSALAENEAVFNNTPFEAIQGESFTTTIYLEENSNLSGFQIQLLYDSEILELTEIVENEDAGGSFLINSSKVGVLGITYERTSSNLTNKTDLVNLTFKVDENAVANVYPFLTLDEKYSAEATTLVDYEPEALPFSVSFDQLKLCRSGDVNLDQRVSIADVTYLRQHLATLRTLTPYQLTFADSYYDERISIADAVRIQRNLVDDSVILGDRVNVTFYDKDGNVSVVKSVKYGTDLTNIPTLPVLSGYTVIGWSENPDEQTAVNLTDLKENKSVYAIYRKDASDAVTFYKQILTQTYYTNNYLSGDLSLCSDIPYQDNWNAKIYWSSSNNATLNASTGFFSKPIYDADVKLTATIVSYRNGLIEAQDYIDFDYTVTGDFQCPSKEEIKNYLARLFGEKIKTNIALPKRVTNEDVQNQNKKYEVRVNWAVLGSDNAENGIDQITRTAYEQNVTLVANVSFNGVPIGGDGKIYFDDLKLSAITEKEVSDYIIDQIASNTGLSLTTGEFLWNNDTKYNANVRWISKNNTVASVANNQVTISNTAVNGAALPLIAEVTYPTGNGAVTFELSYTVSVVTDNKLLVPGTNIDEDLYDALKTATGVYGNLTTDALKDIKFVYLDLSGYPEITDLSGLTYCTNLRVLNISGLRITRGLNEIASLSKLESLIARDCDFNNDNLSDGGVPILKNMIYLQMLDLSENHLTNLDNVFAEDRRYGRMQEVYLDHNELTDISALMRAPLLRFLLLGDNKLESDDLANFKNFKVLKLLSLANNNIDSISNLKDNRTLLELRLQGNQIKSVKDLRFLTYLQSLYLGNNNISNVFAGSQEGNVSYLKYLTNLEILYLNDNNVQDISDLATLTKLAALNVSNNDIQTLSFLSDKGGTMLELYAENNQIQSFGFIQNLTNLKKLMLSGNSSTYEGALTTYLSGLTQLETLTLSGKDLRDISFLASMPKLVRLDIASCNVAEYGSDADLIALAKLRSTLQYLDISNNGFIDIEPLYELANLRVFYADNVKGDVNAPHLFSLMSDIRYISLENCGITDVGWLSKFRRLVYVDLSGNNLERFDLGGYISERSRATLKYLYIDSRQPLNFINSYTTFDDSVLEELSMENAQLVVDYLPDMANLKYLNLSNSNITDLQGSQPDFYDIFSTERFQTLTAVDITGVQADISVLTRLPNLKTVYSVGVSSEKAFYESNLHTLYELYNRGVDCYLYDYENKYQPNAQKEGREILDNEIEDLSCDITVGANNVFSDSSPFIPSEVNDFDITWTLSNPVNYNISDNHLYVTDYAGIEDEPLILTAEIMVYPGQPPVTREFVINTHILRANAQYLDIDSTGAGDFLARGAQFTYDVKTKAAVTEGFSVPVAPVVDDTVYSYSVVLESGDETPTENALIIENAPQYQIHPETEALEATINISVALGHNGSVVDYTVNKSILIKTRTFEITYAANGGSVISKSDGANVTTRTYFEDMILFNDITVSRDGYTFDGWYKDEELSNRFTDTVMPTENITLYASWKINSYSVTFVSNEGTEVEGVTVDYNALIPKPADPTRPIHLFRGWFKDAELTKPWNFDTDVVAGNTTLYAKWLLDEYTVTYNANGGTGTTSEKVTYGSLITPPTLERDFHTFAGWYKDAACITAWNLATDTVTADVTVYAKWTPNGIKGWVREGTQPVGAEIVDRKWSYTQRSETSSSSSSMSGWTLFNTVRTGWSAWSGWLTWNPDNGVRNVEYGWHYYKTQYHYYRWYNGYGMYTYKYNSSYWFEETFFDYILGNAPGYTAIKSTNGSSSQSTWWCQADLNYSQNNTDKTFVHDLYRDEWRYQDPIYTYYFYKNDNLETQSGNPSGNWGVSNVVAWVKYREK